MAENPESRLTNKLLKALNAIEGCYAEKMHATVYGKPKLDVFGAKNGAMFYIEIKVPGKEPTARQYATMKKWEDEAGILTFWTTSVEYAVERVKEL